MDKHNYSLSNRIESYDIKWIFRMWAISFRNALFSTGLFMMGSTKRLSLKYAPQTEGHWLTAGQESRQKACCPCSTWGTRAGSRVYQVRQEDESRTIHWEGSRWTLHFGLMLRWMEVRRCTFKGAHDLWTAYPIYTEKSYTYMYCIVCVTDKLCYYQLKNKTQTIKNISGKKPRQTWTDLTINLTEKLRNQKDSRVDWGEGRRQEEGREDERSVPSDLHLLSIPPPALSPGVSRAGASF